MSRFVSCLLALLALRPGNAYSQLDPTHPDLCQGNYYTEPQAEQILHNLTYLYHDRSTWEQRAALIRQRQPVDKIWTGESIAPWLK